MRPTIGTQSPVVKQGKASEDKALPLAWEEFRLFRTHGGRANYLCMDWADVAFSATELCRRMSCLTLGEIGPVPCGFSAFGASFPRTCQGAVWTAGRLPLESFTEVPAW